MAVRHKTPRRSCRKGQSIIELTASLIMFVVMIALIFSISAYLYVQHAMVSAAREGARTASLNTDIGDADTQAEGVETVEDYVVTAVQNLTGLVIEEESVTVTPPDPAAAQGNRTVTVQINYAMENPMPVAALLQALGASGEGLDVIPVVSTATMRYEE